MLDAKDRALGIMRESVHLNSLEPVGYLKDRNNGTMVVYRAVADVPVDLKTAKEGMEAAFYRILYEIEGRDDKEIKAELSYYSYFECDFSKKTLTLGLHTEP